MATRSPALGPAEWVVLTFPGTASPAVLVPTLATLVDTGIVRLIDTAVVRKDADGTVRGAEQEDEDLDVGAFDGDVLELFSDQDLASIAAEIERDTTTLVLVWVNRWAAEFADAVQRAGGRGRARPDPARGRRTRARRVEHISTDPGRDRRGEHPMTRRLGRGRGGPGLLSSMARTAVLAGSHLRAPILQAITAVGGAGLVIRGVVDAGPALLGFLPSSVTWLESVVALAALLAPGWAGITTQRQQAPACLP